MKMRNGVAAMIGNERAALHLGRWGGCVDMWYPQSDSVRSPDFLETDIVQASLDRSVRELIW
jgi:hypothetical protein